MNENNNFEIIRNISTYVTDWLREEIRSGSFGKDGYLPSEEELCQKIGVSRPTIRTALATLSAEGYLIRKQGNGTFVNSRGLEVLSYQTTWEFTQLIGASGRKASIKYFSSEIRIPTENEQELLDITKDNEVFSIIRLFMGDDIPVIYSINTFSREFFVDDIDRYPFDLPTPVFFEKYCGRKQTYNYVDVSALPAPKMIVKPLNITIDTPILLFDEIFYDSDFKPLFCAKNYCNDKNIRIRFVQKRP